MRSTLCVARRICWLMVGSSLPFVSFGQNAPKIAPVPADPLELVTGPVQAAGKRAPREPLLQLLARARSNFNLRTGEAAYDLKVAFTADSLGRTDYDGSWELEEIYVPDSGLHWTAKAAAGYSTTRVSLREGTYGEEGTASVIPLRLAEARGLLLDPLPSPAYADRGSIRSATATFQGVALTCLLLARSAHAANPAVGRGWEENEECIDPQSGLLRIYSEAPGRYALYDYSNAPQFRGRVLPRTVTVKEAGRIVSKISVDKIDEISQADPKLFTPTDSMKTHQQTTAIAAATKIARIQGQGPFTAAMTLRPVCVFGVVTPSGQLVEAHSLQPLDPNSDAAVEDAKKIDFSPSRPAEAPPQQHFVFVIENFISLP